MGTYGDVTWWITAVNIHKLKVFEWKELKRIYGTNSYQEIKSVLSNEDIVSHIKGNRWTGHVIMNERRVKIMYDGRLEGKKRR